MTRHAPAAVIAAVLAAGSVSAGGTGPVADLSITKTDGAATYTAGLAVTYTIVVGNLGPDPVAGAAVSDLVMSLPQVTSAAWTCVAGPGATCTAGPFTGNLVDTVGLPVGGTVTYTLVVKTSASATGDLVNTATVTPPAGTTDPVPDPTPNTATDTDTPATIVYVDPVGVDSPTCGATATPCKTIQAAIENTGPDDSVVVGAGTYNECIAIMPGTGIGGVLVVSSDFLTAGTNTTTILDGAGVCDTATTPGPVATVFDLSAIRGFTIKNGGNSGVSGLGAVAITNNVITTNTAAATGGGVRVVTGPNVSNPVSATQISTNTILNNISGSHGGGIYVGSSGQGGVPSLVTINGNTLTGNTAGGTTAASGGGIAVVSETAAASDSSIVVITTNTLDGNVANGASASSALAYGGGIFVTTGGISGSNGLGTERITLGTSSGANVVRNNVADGLGGGVSVIVQPAPGAAHTANVDSNSITSNNGGAGGGGLHLLAHVYDRAVGAAPVTLSASANAITGNHALGLVSDPSVVGGGGIYAELRSERTLASELTFEIFGNSIQSNDASSHGGGASLLAAADDDPQSDGATAATEAAISFHNNLIATNLARDETAAGSSGGGVRGVARARGALAQATLAPSFLTVANNETELGTGGVEFQDVLLPDSLGGSGTASFALTNSIVTGNQGYGVGFAAPLDPSTTLTFSYDDAYGNISGNYQPPLVDPTGTNGNISIDAELDDLFFVRICGPMVDVGDPSIAATSEPMPNGGRVNLGHLGATTSATRTFPDVNGDGTVDGLDVMGIAVSFGACTGPSCPNPSPNYFVAADRDLNDIIDGMDLAYVAAFYAQTCPQ